MKTFPLLFLLIFLTGCSFNSFHFTEYQMDRSSESNAKIRDIVRDISKKYDLKEETDLAVASHTVIYCSNLGLFSIIAIRAYDDENFVIVSLREGKSGSTPSEKYVEIKNELTRKLKDAFGEMVVIEDKIDKMKSKDMEIH